MHESTKALAPTRVELTLRGLLIGGIITLAFTAANVFLGLKVGLTFASSIPAAVISMAVLRMFKNATIWENNIVQTVASAAGTLSSVIFVLPGLVMVGWWTGFPFWQSFTICAAGGILGVMYSVPLRRALVTNSDLPYPEGVAAAEVLHVGAGERAGEAMEENRMGLLALVWSSIAAAFFQVIQALRFATAEFDIFQRVGPSITGMGFNMSLALIGAGHLIGLTVGMAILAGLVIAWGVAIPILTALHPMTGDVGTVAITIWSHYVRFIGAGAIGISAIWTLAKLATPVWKGVTSAMAAQRLRDSGKTEGLHITEQDLPFNMMLGISAICIIPIVIVLWSFLSGGVLASLALPLIFAAVIYIIAAGFFVATACGYMAGLIGSSNSPVSGLAILSAIGASLLLLVVDRNAAPSTLPALVAFALFVTAVLINVATISNDNLQDLKTGQLVGATPWKQQVALVVGVIFGALVIPPILNMLNGAYGFGSSSPHGLPAPQATLISTLAKGVITGKIDWSLISVGVGVGIVICLIDEIGAWTKRFRLPPLAVGLGIYLPAATTSPAVVGAIFGALYNRWVANKPNPHAARRLGVLIASGLIVGESLWGVLYAGIILAAQGAHPLIHAADPSSPLALVGDAFAGASQWIGIALFVIIPVVLYRWIGRRAQTLPDLGSIGTVSETGEIGETR
ncbi:MAG TPA: oligopeptide transporter, OPT family [Candidatus Baltobacteraceae bacterium]|nr:oligopeptide transporter, OPT family [Candidatus Baltobacteraceae bacterium]